MSKSNADQQREYRVLALKNPDGLILTRLQTMLSPSADDALRRILATATLQILADKDPRITTT